MKKKFSSFISFLLVISMVLLGFAACKDDKKQSNVQDDGLYRASAVDSDFSMAEDVSKFVGKVDSKYGYDLAKTLAYDENLAGHLGWRLSGSDEEHLCADFLVDEMNKIGLKDVEKVPVKCDRFQFDDSLLTIEGTDIELMPASYQCNGTGKKGIDAEIVDCGNGTFQDFLNRDVNGKIALVGVDQWNESWIDGYIRQAHERGAVGLVTYSVGGYGTLNGDVINVQDICAPDLIPTAAISKNEAKKIKSALKDGKSKAHLMIDAEMTVDQGISYNVVGKIPGESSDQQIILSGHYDKYWYGFQDDCAAVALVFTVAKAMIESGYQPENDILIVAHGAEEWGKSDSAFDWTTGAWGMTHDAKKDWADKTLALINCELPAFVTGTPLAIGSVPEFRTLVKKLVNDTGLLVTSGEVGLSRKGFDSSTMEDGVSYRWHGVPYFINFFEDEKFLAERYHTIADDKSTYDEDTFVTNINWYGTLAIYIDRMPALELDLTQCADELLDNFDKKYAEEAGIDADAYIEKVKEFKKYAKMHNEKLAQLNKLYEDTVKTGDYDKADSIRIEAQELNKKTLAAFAYLQKHYLKNNDFEIFYGHKALYDNLKSLKKTLAGVDKKELWAKDEKSGVLDNAWKLNAGHDYNYIIYSVGVGNAINRMYDPEHIKIDKATWGFDRQLPVVYVGDTTHKLANQDASEVDWDVAKATYEKAYSSVLEHVKSTVDKEFAAFDALIDILK